MKIPFFSRKRTPPIAGVRYVPGEFADPLGAMRYGYEPIYGWPHATMYGQGQPCGSLRISAPPPVNNIYSLPIAPLTGAGFNQQQYIEQMELTDPSTSGEQVGAQ